MSGGWGQTLFSGAQRQDKGQRQQTEAEEAPAEQEEELLPSEGDGALVVLRRKLRVFIRILFTRIILKGVVRCALSYYDYKLVFKFPLPTGWQIIKRYIEILLQLIVLIQLIVLQIWTCSHNQI